MWKLYKRHVECTLSDDAKKTKEKHPEMWRKFTKKTQ